MLGASKQASAGGGRVTARLELAREELVGVRERLDAARRERDAAEGPAVEAAARKASRIADMEGVVMRRIARLEAGRWL